MKKGSNALTNNPLSHQAAEESCELQICGHEHIHAANCGHKSYVHGDHVCYEHDGHFHYTHDGHAHACEGPHAGKNKAPAKVIPIAIARANKKK